MSFSDFHRKAHPRSNDVTVAFDTTFDPPLSLLYVGTTGDIQLELAGSVGSSKVYPAVPAGTWISLPITKIVAAGTTGVVADFVAHRG